MGRWVTHRGDYYYVQGALYNVRALVLDNGFRLEEQATNGLPVVKKW
ncbi:MAG: hypothetical protein GY869_22315 [Planctomycetes bacterium]|nr:hypothetical protein [Planctomycetota bacterium]